MLASPLRPTSGFSEDAAQYRPAKDLEAFNALLPPPIEFVEGSSSGTLAIVEAKYQPINAAPSRTEAHDSKSHSQAIRTKSPKPQSAPHGKSLWNGTLETSWPSNASVGTGLNNIGNSCFLNSALQCLLHTPPLLHVLLAHTKSDPCRVPKSGFCMSCAMRQVMLDAHQKRNSITPYPVANRLTVIAKHMRRGRQEDSHEFLRYAIDALQKSCLAGHSPKLDPKLAETTWVHKIFGGRLRSRVTCLECGYNSDTFDSILDLSVDIHGVSGLKEAMRRFVQVDHLRGANKYKCEKCKKAVAADKQFTVYEAPLVLTVHLKRFTPMGRKLGHPLSYDERLSLQPVMSEGQHGPTYSLYGVISHAGGGPNSGHYYAHVKSANGQWHEMNDDYVSRVSSAPTSMRNAYILFYMRDKGQALESAVRSTGASAASQAPKQGVAASMKKRKNVIESDDEDDAPPSSKAKTIPAPFIGPLLPSPQTTESSPANGQKQKPAAADPQADFLKKRIANAAQSPSKALQSLAQYEDEDEGDDIGEKIEEPEKEPEVEKPLPPTTEAAAPSAPPSPKASDRASSPPAPKPSAAIPPSSFYGASSKAKDNSAKGAKKRKSPDGEDEDADKSLGEWARTPLSPSASSPKKNRHSEGRKSFTGNPFNRLKGSNNLLSARDSAPPIHRYGKKKRMLI